MRKILTLLIATTAITASAYAGWQEHWINAIQQQAEKNYVEAEDQFTSAIKLIENDKEELNRHVYTDRAMLYFEQERYYDALADLNLALDCPNLVRQDKIDALNLRSVTYLKLDMQWKSQEDYIEYAKLDPNMPLVDFCDQYLVIRHCPTRQDGIDALTDFFVRAKMCEKGDIKIYDNNVLIVKLKKACCTQCKEDKKCESFVVWPPVHRPHIEPEQHQEQQKKLDEQLKKQIEGCNWYCDTAFNTCIAYLGKAQLKFWPVQVLIKTFEAMRNKCYDCCSGNGGFYQVCMQPILDFCNTWQDW